MGSVEQKSVIWKHFRFLHMPDVENSEITSHVGKSEIYPVLLPIDFQKIKNFMLADKLWIYCLGFKSNWQWWKGPLLCTNVAIYLEQVSIIFPRAESVYAVIYAVIFGHKLIYGGKSEVAAPAWVASIYFALTVQI